MDLTKEQVRKIMECKTADELLALAKSEGIELTREQAEEFIANMKTMELTEAEIKQVAGGSGCVQWCPGDADLTCPCHVAECPSYWGNDPHYACPENTIPKWNYPRQY